MLPFDPEKARGSRYSVGSSADQDTEKQHTKNNRKSDKSAFTVEQVVTLINNALADNLPGKMRIVGEISNLSQRRHWYFSLKDEAAVLRCVAWQSKTRSFNFDAKDGMEVVATGSIQHYGPQGQTQLYVDKLEPVGAGALELKFRALCEELKSRGYFEIEHKKALPAFPQSIAVITSAKGAALQDVLNTAKRRCPAVKIVTVDVLVQGDSAAPAIVQGLRTVADNRDRLGIDAVILTRGGGSIEDLWAFNEKIVAEALYNFPLPIVAAIGHETDTTIAELVADQRCATPTQAAMVLIPDQFDLRIQVDHVQSRFDLTITQRIRFHQQHLQTIRARLGSPAELLKHLKEKLRKNSAQLDRAIQHRYQIIKSTLESSREVLASLDPVSVIKRGYSITRRADNGSIIHNMADVTPNTEISTQVTDGIFSSRVLHNPECRNTLTKHNKLRKPANNNPESAIIDEQTAHCSKDIVKKESAIPKKEHANTQDKDDQNRQLNLFASE